jgi:hypothetical protein
MPDDDDLGGSGGHLLVLGLGELGHERTELHRRLVRAEEQLQVADVVVAQTLSRAIYTYTTCSSNITHLQVTVYLLSHDEVNEAGGRCFVDGTP